MSFVATRPLFIKRFSGQAWISGEDTGIVSVNGVPAVKRIFAFDAATMQLVRSTWSDKNGNYKLANLDPNRQYLIIARDHTGSYDPVAYDNIVPFNPTD